MSTCKYFQYLVLFRIYTALQTITAQIVLCLFSLTVLMDALYSGRFGHSKTHNILHVLSCLQSIHLSLYSIKKSKQPWLHCFTVVELLTYNDCDTEKHDNAQRQVLVTQIQKVTCKYL